MDITSVSSFIIPIENPKATGFLHDINQKQIDKLEDLKKHLRSHNILDNFIIFNDQYLLRFLRARKFDLHKTTKMFSDFLNWRIKHDTDNISTFQFTETMEIKAIYPHGYHKTCKIGRPIYIELINKVNIDDVFKITTEERMIKYYIKEYERTLKERFPACSKIQGRLIEQSVTILNLDGVGLGMMSGKVKKFIKIATDIGQDNYPEMLGKMFLLNTSFMFSAIWSIVKGFIDEKTRNKISVQKSNYLKTLLEYIDDENLPVFLGGKCECKEIEGGCLYSDIGPWNPTGGIDLGFK